MKINTDNFECLGYWAEPEKAPPIQYLEPDNTPSMVKSDLRYLDIQDIQDIQQPLLQYSQKQNFIK